MIGHQTGDLLNKGWHIEYCTGVKQNKKKPKEALYVLIREHL